MFIPSFPSFPEAANALGALGQDSSVQKEAKVGAARPGSVLPAGASLSLRMSWEGLASSQAGKKQIEKETTTFFLYFMRVPRVKMLMMDPPQNSFGLCWL